MRANRTRETVLRTSSAAAIAAPSQTQPVTSRSTAKSEEFTVFPRFDQFHSHSGRLMT